MTDGSDIWKACGAVAARIILTGISIFPPRLCFWAPWWDLGGWHCLVSASSPRRCVSVMARTANPPHAAAGRDPAKALTVPVVTQSCWEQLPGSPAPVLPHRQQWVSRPASPPLFPGDAGRAGAGMLLLGGELAQVTNQFGVVEDPVAPLWLPLLQLHGSTGE